ncbi:unnamed protein product [Dovyalis caffra]|uniref:Uncharacterized protein n=1 Tax=Dovyalis caffra TaxID=77055 RepID=A0AAV1R6V6_9ROSI|nr:unnamed protein product [Dovyalis caffra]CAK7328740.1 unnamed protein product [Dovyalis caffra]
MSSTLFSWSPGSKEMRARRELNTGSGYGLGKESERLNENRHRMELIGSPLLKKRRRRAQGSTSSSYYDYVSFDYRDLAHSMPSTKEVFSTSGSSVEWKPPKEKNATLSKGEGRATDVGQKHAIEQAQPNLSVIKARQLYMEQKSIPNRAVPLPEPATMEVGILLLKAERSRGELLCNVMKVWCSVRHSKVNAFNSNRMGPNKLSTFVPAANKSEVSLESELAALVLVQDRKVWDRLLMALEASNRPGRSRSEVRESKSYLFLSSLSALLLEVGV